ncbi:MAG: trypsin-like peptidase domain-containing protein [Aureliella sp.]
MATQQTHRTHSGCSAIGSAFALAIRRVHDSLRTKMFECLLGFSLAGLVGLSDLSTGVVWAQTAPTQADAKQADTKQTDGKQAAAEPAPDEAENAAGGLALVESIEKASIAAIEKAERSVVAIARVRKDQAPGMRAELLQVPGQLQLLDAPESPEYIPDEFASGVVVSPDGMIVTCAHALDDPRKYDYYVWLDKRVYPARVLSRPAQVMASDPYTDLAILKVEATDLVSIEFGDSSQLHKGSFVISLGNPYATARDGQASASWGIVANLQRAAPPRQASESSLLAKESQHQFGTLIQTDARLNLGTSGGALINLRGEMVGLTSSLAALSGFEQAAGYAIAVDDMFRRVVDALKTGHLPEFGFLGIQPEELRPHERAAGFSGARVSLVLPGLPGDLAGLRNDDCIAEINNKPIPDRNALFRELSQFPAGAQIDLLVQRPRRGDVPFVPLHLKATLSKKLVATSRPAYALHAPKPWRGMMVEYITAVPGELMRGGAMAQRRTPAKLAILSVDPDSPAWRAGLRAGHALLSLGGTRLQTPEDFYKKAQSIEGPAQLQVYRGSDRLETITVAP